jgi:hypothetical protein
MIAILIKLFILCISLFTIECVENDFMSIIAPRDTAQFAIIPPAMFTSIDLNVIISPKSPSNAVMCINIEKIVENDEIINVVEDLCVRQNESNLVINNLSNGKYNLYTVIKESNYPYLVFEDSKLKSSFEIKLMIDVLPRLDIRTKTIEVLSTNLDTNSSDITIHYNIEDNNPLTRFLEMCIEV